MINYIYLIKNTNVINMNRILNILFWVLLAVSVICFMLDMSSWIVVLPLFICCIIPLNKESNDTIEISVSLPFLLVMVFVVLKGCKVIDWNLWWIIAPLLINLGIHILVLSFDWYTLGNLWDRISAPSIRFKKRTIKNDEGEVKKSWVSRVYATHFS